MADLDPSGQRRPGRRGPLPRWTERTSVYLTPEVMAQVDAITSQRGGYGAKAAVLREAIELGLELLSERPTQPQLREAVSA